MVKRQASRLGPLHHELQQLRFLEDAQDQFAVPDVVDGQRWLVVSVAPVDLGHLVVLVADGFALAQQRLRDAFQAERWKTPYRRPQRLDAVDDDTARSGGKEIALLARMGPPCDGLALPAQQQRGAMLVSRLLQHPQVELDDAPAHDDVRVVARKPVVQAVDHGLAGGQVDERKVQGLRGRKRFCGRLAQHVDHALWHAVQRNGIELPVFAGLYVQRHELQHRAIVGLVA